MNKMVGIGLVFVVLLGIAGAGYYLTQGLDNLVKTMIERVGSDTTKTAVNVRDVKISLTEGSGNLGGLTIANPAGFTPGSLFSMENIGIKIDSASLTRDVYVIKEITVDGASILVEQIGGGTNLQALMNGMKPGEGVPAEPAPATSPESSTRLAINEINFSSGSVLLKSDVFGERTLTLPDFALRDIGSAEAGLTPDQLGQAIGVQLIGEVRDAVADELKTIAREEATRKLKEKFGDATNEGINKLKGLFGGKEEADATPN